MSSFGLIEKYGAVSYLFSCTSCEPEIVLPVLQIKTKTISRAELVQST